jgi:hypothetical protein
LSFAQQNINVIGRIPSSEDNRLYQIQVGAFGLAQNAQRAFERLSDALMNPAFENYLNLTRVIVRGIPARDVWQHIDRLQRIGFSEVILRLDTETLTTPVTPTIASTPEIPAATVLPTSTALLPSSSLTEIGFRTIRVGEVGSLIDIAETRNVVSWVSSTPSVVRVDSNGNATGQNIGNAFIRINDREYISVVIVPQEDFFVVPESQISLLPGESNRGSTSIQSITEYRTEPTFRLAYRFTNRGEHRGASGRNGGIDILARGENYEWLWTTYYQGGWFYDLNGVHREMLNGFQKDARNGVELKIIPEFVYDKGITYLQLRHQLHNPNNFPISEQRFGASADVMIHQNDYASLLLTPYGAYMTDSIIDPSIELMFVCLSGNNITPVDTLWLGTYLGGAHIDYIYTDRRYDIHGQDSAIGFSYQNINLSANETKEFIVRFTLARHEY